MESNESPEEKATQASVKEEPVPSKEETVVKESPPAKPKPKPPPPPSKELKAFLDGLAEVTDVEEALKQTITFMETSLEKRNSSGSRDFWGARRHCSELFKDKKITPVVRAELWDKHQALVQDARALKATLDEQSAFAVEQIDIAIQGFEKELGSIEEHMSKVPEEELSEKALCLEKSRSFYQTAQKELKLLNVYAVRVNSMRKELIKTDMRVKHKNKFFKRLSSAGDLVFPRRKKIIDELSERFVEDVEGFQKLHFSKEKTSRPLHSIREEIKELQAVAKQLTINTSCFTKTRKMLSSCWDVIKEKEKEKRKEFSEKKEQWQEAAKTVEAKIKEYIDRSSELSDDVAVKQLDEISAFMRKSDLAKDDVKRLRGQLTEERKKRTAKEEAKKERRKEIESNKKEEMRLAFDALQKRFETAVEKATKQSSSEVELAIQSLQDELNGATFSSQNKEVLELILHEGKSLVQEKKVDEQLAALSSDQKTAEEQIHSILDELDAWREVVKEKLEAARKESAKSGLDIEKALKYNALVTVEKERLEKIEEKVEEVEVKLGGVEEGNL